MSLEKAIEELNVNIKALTAAMQMPNAKVVTGAPTKAEEKPTTKPKEQTTDAPEEVTLEQLTDSFKKLAQVGKRPAVVAVLEGLGVSKLQELEVSKYAEWLKAVNAALAGLEL